MPRFGIRYTPKVMSAKQAYFDHLRWKLKQENRNRATLDAQLDNNNFAIGESVNAALDVGNQIAARTAAARVQAEVKAKIAERNAQLSGGILNQLA